MTSSRSKTPNSQTLSDNLALEVRDLKFSYPDSRIALAGVSFKISPAESVVLMGANGAGKSTLLLCLVGILKGSGTIRAHGVEVNPDNVFSIRRQIGFVFQNPEHQLFSPAVLEDVIFGPLNMGLSREEALKRAEKTLAELNMTEFKQRAPHHLSQGEKKKVALATALVMEPSILLLDEPTAGLDPRSSTQLIDILFRLKDEGKTMLVATHDMHLAEEIADRIIVLGENKTVVRDGSPREILTDTAFLARNNLIHEHSHFHELRRHGHPHSHLHHEDDHTHPHL